MGQATAEKHLGPSSMSSRPTKSTRPSQNLFLEGDIFREVVSGLELQITSTRPLTPSGFQNTDSCPPAKHFPSNFITSVQSFFCHLSSCIAHFWCVPFTIKCLLCFAKSRFGIDKTSLCDSLITQPPPLMHLLHSSQVENHRGSCDTHRKVLCVPVSLGVYTCLT